MDNRPNLHFWWGKQSSVHPFKADQINADAAFCAVRYLGVLDGVGGVSLLGMHPVAMALELGAKVPEELEKRLETCRAICSPTELYAHVQSYMLIHRATELYAHPQSYMPTYRETDSRLAVFVWKKNCVSHSNSCVFCCCLKKKVFSIVIPMFSVFV